MDIPMAKVVLLGDMAVGKTSIVLQICKGKFVPGVGSTIGVSYVAKVFESTQGKIELRIWDTAGQEAFRSVIPSYLRGSDACILVASVVDAASVDHLADWYSFLREHHQDYKVVYVVLNKIDLMGDEALLRRAREWCEAQELPWFETTAIQYATLNPLIQRMVEDLYDSSKVSESVMTEFGGDPPSKCC